jgi:chromosome segregation ATPase
MMTLYVYVCLAALCGTVTGAAQPAANCESGQSQALLSEVKSLRIELLQDKIERVQFRIAQLHTELQQAETDRNHIRQQERLQAEEAVELQAALSRPDLTPEERSDVETNRSHLISTGGARLAERASAIARRAGELRGQLEQQQRLSGQLQETLRTLTSSPPRV